MHMFLGKLLSYASSDGGCLAGGGVAVFSALLGSQLAFQAEPVAPASPYMDEEFHIRQAQAICSGDFYTWDHKITTLPGLYYASASMLWLMRLAGLDAPCSPRNLRATQLAFSRLFLVCLCYIASVAVQRLRQTFAQPRALALSPPAVTGALWVAAVGSFPVLFFCGVLYYTDMLSAGLVVASAAAAGSFAWQLHAPPPSPLRSWASAAVALAAACVRQNNVVWAALTAVTVALQVWAASARALGAPRLLSRAGVGALLASGPQLLPRLAPFVLLAAAAVAFVIHNGGVVVGDRSSHTAVPHLAQFGYAAGVWALYLIVFDGADIALRLACAGKHSLTPQQAAWLSCLTGWLGYSRTAAAKLDGSPARETLALADSSCTQERGSASEEDPKSDVASLAGGDRATLARQSNRDTAPRSRARAASSSRNRNLKPAAASDTAATAELAVPEQPKNSPAEHYKPSSEATKRVSLSPSMRLAVLAAVVAIVAGLVDAFTYEHEYLLSDNRHFTFYVWRRVLQPRRWLRASLAIVYVAGALLLSARIISASSLYLDEPEREAAPTRNTSASAAPAVGSGSKGTSNLASTADSAAPAGERQLVAARPPAAGVGAQAERQPCPASAIGQRSSSANDETRLQREVTALWLVCFFAASALAVVPSRLLEPRYFIMTTLIALLNTPPDSPIAPALMLAAHIAVNAGTLWIFIFRPFTWSDGSVARFMW